MSQDLGPLRALAASARLANLPSVLCNIWLGAACALATGAAASWPAILCVSAAGCMLYLAGNFLNDWHDRAWDAIHRPERALPRRLFAPAFYQTLALLLALGGIAAAAAAHIRSGGVALVICVCVLIYTHYHKRAAWSLLALALCRALLPVMALLAFAAEWQAAVLAAAGALLCHTLGISLTARQEGRGDGVPRSAWLCVAAAALLMFGASRLLGRCAPEACLAALLPYALWTSLGLSWLRGRPRVRHAPQVEGGVQGAADSAPPMPMMCRCVNAKRLPSPSHGQGESEYRPSLCTTAGPFLLNLTRMLVQMLARKPVPRLLAGFPLLDWILLLPLAPGLFPAGPAGWISLWLPPVAWLAGLALQRLAPAT